MVSCARMLEEGAPASEASQKGSSGGFGWSRRWKLSVWRPAGR